MMVANRMNNIYISPRQNRMNNIYDINEEKIIDDNLEIVEELDLGDKVKKIEGIIKGETEKALLLKTNSDGEFWFPKSTIKSEYNSAKESKQLFIIDSWILEKNKVPA